MRRRLLPRFERKTAAEQPRVHLCRGRHSALPVCAVDATAGRQGRDRRSIIVRLCHAASGQWRPRHTPLFRNRCSRSVGSAGLAALASLPWLVSSPLQLSSPTFCGSASAPAALHQHAPQAISKKARAKRGDYKTIDFCECFKGFNRCVLMTEAQTQRRGEWAGGDWREATINDAKDRKLEMNDCG